MRSIAVIALFTLLSGVGDALGFVHASRVWREGRFVWVEALTSAVAFQFGVAMYWFALRGLVDRGVVAIEVQTLFWFGATLAGVAVLSRQFFAWSPAAQLVALCVLIGIGWLMVHTTH